LEVGRSGEINKELGLFPATIVFIREKSALGL